MKIHYLQHEPFEDPGSILAWAAERHHTLSSTMVYDGESLPAPASFDMLVIMGGSMSVYEEDRYPWISSEKSFIAEAISHEKAVLGVCLGAQLIASALGARVYPNPCKEIGWFPVSLTADGHTSPFCNGWPTSFTAFHWHSDTFDIPAGARRTAFSKATKNQSFEYGRRIIALQYHIESTPESVARLVAESPSESKGLYIQPADEILAYQSSFTFLRQQLFRLLDTMLAPIESETSAH